MSVDFTQSWAYSEDVCQEDAITIATRQMAREFGIVSISPATGFFLQAIASGSHIRSVVEIGTGTGVSGLYLLGASSSLSLTTIDVESEAQHVAREAFGRAGVRPGRTRLINGRSADILPRLASGSYDMVLIDGDPMEAAGDAQEALRILKPGGMLVLARALCGGRVADPARREEDVVAIRTLGKELIDAPELHTSLVPIGDGIIVSALHPTA